MSCLQLRYQVRISCQVVLCISSWYYRIIEPLASRCSKFRFKPLDPTSTAERLQHIATAEHVDVSQEVISTLISTSQGDLRRSITYLQSASRLAGSTNPPTPITPSDIQEIAGVVPTPVIEDLATTLGVELVNDGMEVDGPTQKVAFETIQKKVKQIVRDGYSGTQILTQVGLLFVYVVKCSAQLDCL